MPLKVVARLPNRSVTATANPKAWPATIVVGGGTAKTIADGAAAVTLIALVVTEGRPGLLAMIV